MTGKPDEVGGVYEQLRVELRLRHYSPRTERAYVGWRERYIACHGRRHPATLGAPELKTLLDALVQRKMAASSHQQAICALQFFYTKSCASTHRGSKAWRVLRGNRDRVTLLPTRLRALLHAHVEDVRRIHRADLKAGAGYVELPGALLNQVSVRRARMALAMGISSDAPLRDPAVNSDATTSTKPSFSAPSTPPAKPPISPNPPPATPSATALPPTSSMPATTSAPFKSSSATATSPRQ